MPAEFHAFVHKRRATACGARSTHIELQRGSRTRIWRMARITSAQRKTATDSIATGASQARLVQGLSRGLTVLRAFGPGDTSLSNSELAERTLLPKSTVSRLTHTLTGFGYL